MAKTAAERKRDQRKRRDHLGIKPMTLDVSIGEREEISAGAERNGYTDKTEFVLALVYENRDKSRFGRTGHTPALNLAFIQAVLEDYADLQNTGRIETAERYCPDSALVEAGKIASMIPSPTGLGG